MSVLGVFGIPYAFAVPPLCGTRSTGVSRHVVRIDLHRHLEGSHSATALAAVAERFQVKDPLFFDGGAGRYRTPDELTAQLTMARPSDDASIFYGCIVKARAAYVSEAAIGELSRRAFVEAAADTDGLEMRASLFSMTRTLLDNEGVAWRELPPVQFAERARSVLLAVLAARDEAVASEGKPMLLRVGFSRTFESEPHYQALAAVLPEHRADICGLDVLGIVTGGDKEPMPAPLRQILTQLRPDFPDLTLHAGEFEDYRSVERSLELQPQAIGHGIHAVTNDPTLRRLAEEGITLEVCPSSNRLLIPTALARLEQHIGTAPLCALQKASIHCVLGSDDPTPMGTTFTKEWALAEAAGADMALLERDIDRRWKQLTG